MDRQAQFIAFWTIFSKEVQRFFRIWPQTLLPSAITTTLYFVVFGSLIGSRIGDMDGTPYVAFIVPGLIMMSVVNNSYTNVVSSFFSAKFQKHIEELLVSPTPNWIILWGYVAAGMMRGLICAAIVTAIALVFTDLGVHAPLTTIAVTILAALVFSLGGFVNAMLARKFDDVSFFPTFVLTPLTYLGGVFYTIDLLPPFWRTVSLFNPILHLVNTLRYGILGVSDVSRYLAFGVLAVVLVVTHTIALVMLERGTGLRS
ncbi:ABC-2 type transporter [Isosphaera pallida ATCC 43644]|uniref:Transport permease protein n=1 Tax=Isosphaera pallida (strain ATCC 43644 / DSM 9630 / IS1B) TaxID=575540 RepID=E8R5J4_ISOPI|nr:ABC transporter permease [Isosphaera pallida]ADV61743.1 ABC-2 type transporter [Isosphaera pallida ATCC 43644]